MRKKSARRGLASLLSLMLTLGLCLSAAGNASAAEVTETEETALTEVLQGEETAEETEEDVQSKESMSALEDARYYQGGCGGYQQDH